MKALKIIFVGFAICFVLAILAVASLFTPPVQKSIFLALASAVSDVRDVSIDTIEVDFAGVEIENLKFETDQGTYSVASARFDASLIDLLTAPRAEISELTLNGFVLDLNDLPKNAEPVPVEPTEPAAFRLPSLTDFDAFERRSVLHGSGDLTIILSESETLKVAFVARDFVPGSEGRLTLDWHWAQPAVVARLGEERELAGIFELSAVISSQGVLQRLDMNSELNLAVEGRALDPLKLSASLEDSNQGLILDSRILFSKAEDSENELLAGVFEIPSKLDKVKYRGQLSLDSQTLSPLMEVLEMTLPDFQIDSELAVEFKQESGAIIAESRGSANYGDLSNRFDLLLNGVVNSEFRGRVTGYVTSTAGDSGARVELSGIDASLAPDTALRALANLNISHSGETERLRLQALIPSDSNLPVSFSFASDDISIPVLQSVSDEFLASLPETSSESSEPPSVSNPFEVERPIQLSGKIGRLVINEPWSLDAVELDTRIAEGSLKLNKMDFNFLSGRFANSGVVGFQDGAFALDAKSNLQHLAVASAMTTLGVEPIVDTTLGGDVTWLAEAESMQGLIDNLHVGWDFQAPAGTINIPESKIMRSVRGATQAASLLGTFLPGQGYLGNFSKIVDKADVVELSEVNFSGQRTGTGSIKIQQLELKGSDFYAQVAGDIRSKSWSDILESAARFQLNLGSKGEVSELANQIGLIDGRVRDDYELWGKMPFSITGTLQTLNFGTLQDWALDKVVGSSKSALTGRGSSNAESGQDASGESASEQITREAQRVLGGLLESVLGD